jgi:hypothetical protein
MWVFHLLQSLQSYRKTCRASTPLINVEVDLDRQRR